MTLIEEASAGKITIPVATVAGNEGIDPESLTRRVAEGRVAIMQRGDRALGIGQGLCTKVNVNIGTSTLQISQEKEVTKAKVAEKLGADTISDLSMGGDIPCIRREIFRHTTVPITTVPIYQTAAEVGLQKMQGKDILTTIHQQAEQGISSLVIHGVNWRILDLLKGKKRLLPMVSKGGSITSAYMCIHDCDNPFFEFFDEILAILKRYDIVLSLGNTARSGCIQDARDRAQQEEIRQNISLAERAHAEGVQVIIEGAGGHIRYDRIARYIRYYKRHTRFPLFVAGPLPTDIAIGYDHIAGCVGASVASANGADYLCYLTPAEHLCLPNAEHVREGLVAFKIAAHIGDMVKYGKDGADRALSLKRAELDRSGQLAFAIDEDRVKVLAGNGMDCSMCGDFCAIRMMKNYLGSR
jgi:phosphomethylpyrimidine synthase